MARTNHHGTLERISALTPTLRELVIRRDSPPDTPFRTGQFIMLHIPQSEGAAKRAYSIASSEECQTELKLLIKLVPNGIASEYVKSLQNGASVEFSGPFGKCFFLTPPPEQVIFLCTGAGLSQHFSMLVSQGLAYPKTHYFLYIGVWNESEIFYLNELEELKRKLPNFQYHFVLDQGGPTWKGKTGYVTDYLKDHQVMTHPTHVYLCGNPAMIKGAKKMLIEDMRFSKDHLVAEAFN